jgi:hypothetical protein
MQASRDLDQFILTIQSTGTRQHVGSQSIDILRNRSLVYHYLFSYQFLLGKTIWNASVDIFRLLRQQAIPPPRSQATVPTRILARHGNSFSRASLSDTT